VVEVTLWPIMELVTLVETVVIRYSRNKINIIEKCFLHTFHILVLINGYSNNRF
jgi:hypothetical protein